jgi:hypothetical protein
MIKCNSALRRFRHTHGVSCTRLVPLYRKGNTPRGCLMVTSLKRTAIFFIIDPICNLESPPKYVQFRFKIRRDIWNRNCNQRRPRHRWCSHKKFINNRWCIRHHISSVSDSANSTLVLLAPAISETPLMKSRNCFENERCLNNRWIHFVREYEIEIDTVSKWGQVELICEKNWAPKSCPTAPLRNCLGKLTWAICVIVFWIKHKNEEKFLKCQLLLGFWILNFNFQFFNGFAISVCLFVTIYVLQSYCKKVAPWRHKRGNPLENVSRAYLVSSDKLLFNICLPMVIRNW